MPYSANFLRIMECLTVSKAFDKSLKAPKYTGGVLKMFPSRHLPAQC